MREEYLSELGTDISFISPASIWKRNNDYARYLSKSDDQNKDMTSHILFDMTVAINKIAKHFSLINGTLLTSLFGIAAVSDLTRGNFAEFKTNSTYTILTSCLTAGSYLGLRYIDQKLSGYLPKI